MNAGMEVDKGTKCEGFSGVKVKKERAESIGRFECVGCLKLRAKIKQINEKYTNLEYDIGKKKCVIEWLDEKLGFVELQKLKVEDEVRVLKQRNGELEQSTRNVKEEHGVFSQLMISNEVLEREKKKSEIEVGIWKVKCKELEAKVMELEKRLSAGMIQSGSHLLEMHPEKRSHVGGLLHGFSVADEAENKGNDKDLLGTPPLSPPLKQHSCSLDMHSKNTRQAAGLLDGFGVAAGPAALLAEIESKPNVDKDVLGTPSIRTPFKQYSDDEWCKGGRQCEFKSTVRKCLDFAGEESPHKDTSPRTPPVGPIDISDSDDDCNTGQMHSAGLHCKVQNKVRSSCTGLWVSLDEKDSTLKDGYVAVVENQKNEEEITCYTAGQPMPKRRNVGTGVAYELSSDSETEDKIPLSRLKSFNPLMQSSGTLLKRRSVDGSCFRDNSKKQPSALTDFLTDGKPKDGVKKAAKVLRIQFKGGRTVQEIGNSSNSCTKSAIEKGSRSFHP